MKREKQYLTYTSWIWLLILTVAACSSEPPIPKPRAYPKVVYPTGDYKPVKLNYCHFIFQYPDYVKFEKTEQFFDKKSPDPCWFDIFYPSFDARIHFSYYPINNNPERLAELLHDTFKMAGEHTMRANYINEEPIQGPNATGIGFEIKGPAASPYQFYLTDSTQHFLRAALYFNTQARPDSLAPITAFIRKDIEQMIGSLEWTK